MRRIEGGSQETPWKWYYDHYQDIERSKTTHDSDLLKKLPLPSTWLAAPAVFIVIWLAASLYTPVRLIFDASFAVDSCRSLALGISLFVAVVALAALSFLIYRVKVWWYNWQL